MAANAPEEIEQASWNFAPGGQIAPGLHAVDLLGDGKRFETWLAWSTPLWSAVSVKLPNPARIDERSRRSLANEAATVGRFAHPGVQRLLESRLEDECPLLVFEYAEGPTLDSLVAEDGRLSAGDGLRLAMQLAAILHYVHGEGVVHLDVKPENIVVRDGRVLLLDFDIATPIGHSHGGDRPRGSAPFMSPEQIRCEPSTPAMDVFALGAVLYEAVTGKSAFHSPPADDDRRFPQLEERPLPPRLLNPALPVPAESVIDRLLDPDPARRPASAAGALALLAAALAPGDERLWPDWADELLLAP